MHPEKRKKYIKIAVFSILIFMIVRWGIQRIMAPPQINTTPTVTVQQPKLKQITPYVTQTGTMVAYNSVNLVARVEGYLEEIKFTDGTMVKKGTELFVIEPQPYLEKLKEAQASVIIQRASNDYDRSEYARQKKMYRQQATSLNNVEKWHAKSIESAGQIAKTVANEQIATINYSYTHVCAPFDGRIGRHLVDPGNLVGHGSATDLATIQQIDPIYVYFNLNELDLIKLRTIANKHGIDPNDLNNIPVYVGLQNDSTFPYQGHLNFVNTGLNASTGTMEFRALLKNKDYALLPGMFVHVRIPVGEPKTELTIPNVAIQYDQIGPYVLTVDAQQQVQLKRVTLGALDQNNRSISTGLTATDRIVVSGLQNATPGQTVNIQPLPKENT